MQQHAAPNSNQGPQKTIGLLQPTGIILKSPNGPTTAISQSGDQGGLAQYVT
jgi:hypothetical protein